MAYYDTPMSKLEAVNVALRGIGQDEAITLNDDWPDVQQASKLVDDLTRQLQIRGWHWNTEKTTLSPDVNGNINLPNNVIAVDTTDEDIGIDVIQRGSKLYNTETSTYVFDRPLKVEMTLLLEFSYMPLIAKDYIACLTTIQLQQNLLGSDSVDKFLKERCQQSMVLLRQDENRRSDRNTLRDNWSSFGIVQRTYFRRGAY